MNEALTYIYYFYDRLINFVFNDMEFFKNVTFGWVLITCIVFGLLIRNILRIPVHGNITIKKESGDKNE